MILTLLSDFGFQDSFVAVAKGLLLQQHSTAQIIDLNHEVEPFHLLQCSYLLKSSYQHFPANTVHLVLFDLMNQQPAVILLAKIKDQFIVTADNGLLPIAFDTELEQVYRFDAKVNSYVEWIQQAAQLIATLQQQHFSCDFLSIVQPLVHPMQAKPLAQSNTIECQIVHIDRFGNVVANITQSTFERLRNERKFRIQIFRETITVISKSYNDVSESNVLCRFNSAGYLEIAINKGMASRLLGLQLYSEKNLFYQYIKIEFE